MFISIFKAILKGIASCGIAFLICIYTVKPIVNYLIIQKYTNNAKYTVQYDDKVVSLPYNRSEMRYEYDDEEQTLSLQNNDHLRQYMMHIPENLEENLEDIKYICIFIHGFTGYPFVPHYIDFMKNKFKDNKFMFFSISMSYNENDISQWKFDIQDIISNIERDIQQIRKYIKANRLHDKQIILMGFSLGGTILCDLWSRLQQQNDDDDSIIKNTDIVLSIFPALGYPPSIKKLSIFLIPNILISSYISPMSLLSSNPKYKTIRNVYHSVLCMQYCNQVYKLMLNTVCNKNTAQLKIMALQHDTIANFQNTRAVYNHLMHSDDESEIVTLHIIGDDMRHSIANEIPQEKARGNWNIFVNKLYNMIIQDSYTKISINAETD